MNIKERLLRLRLAAVGDIKQQRFHPTGIAGTRKVTTSPKKFLDKASAVKNMDYDIITKGPIETNSGKVSELAGVHGGNPDVITNFSRNFEAGGDEGFFTDKHFGYDETGQHVYPVKYFPKQDSKGNYTKEFYEKDRKLIDGVWYEGVDSDKLDAKGNIIKKKTSNKILDRDIREDDTEISDNDVSDYRKREIFRGDELGTIEFLKRKIRRGDSFETPYFTVRDGEITGHEGRHRARALMEEGVQEIPVELTDATAYDTVENILGQEGSLSRLESELEIPAEYDDTIKRSVDDVLTGHGKEYKVKARNVKKRLDEILKDTRAPIFGRFSKQRTAIQTKHNVRINPQQGLEIADAYDQLQHRPNDPDVKAAYDAFNKETMDQFNKLRSTGLQITKLKPNQKGYSSAEEMHKDILENQHLSYFPSESGFGSSEVKDHPMLQGSGIIDAEGKEMPYNDIFRIVHDIQGHNLGNKSDFSPEGEHAAYLTHKQQYSPLAQRALFTETAGQANWGAFNRKSGARNRDLISRGRFNELEFAPQKADILSDEFINREFHI